MADQDVSVRTKAWYQSVTVWLNVATILGVLIPLVTAYIGFLEGASFVGERMSLLIGTTLALVSSSLNVVVRLYLTGSPISGTPVAQAGANPPPAANPPG